MTSFDPVILFFLLGLGSSRNLVECDLICATLHKETQMTNGQHCMAGDRMTETAGHGAGRFCPSVWAFW